MKPNRTKTPLWVLLRAVTAALALLCLTPAARAEVVFDEEHFPDSEFRRYLTSQFKFTEGSTLTDDQLAKVTGFTLTPGYKATDLAGIEFFTDLKTLTIGGYLNSVLTTTVTKVDLSQNTALTSLTIYGPLDFADVHAPTSLTWLRLHNGPYATLTLDPSYTALQTLTITGNAQLTTVSLSNLANLQELSIGGNAKLADITLSDLNALQELSIGSNAKLADITLSDLNALQDLSITGNAQLAELDLSNLENLQSLFIRENSQLKDINLTDVKALQSMTVIKNAAIEEISLSSLENLQSVYIWDNAQLAEVNLSNLENLQSAEVYENKQLTRINLVGLENLPKLYVEANVLLEDLDLSGLANLKFLSTSKNAKLTHLDLGNNPHLTILNCSKCALESLDLSKNPYLVSLDCSSNLLTTLDLSANTALQTLDCSMNNHNKLTELDLSANTALLSLDCNCNQLTSLNLSGNKKLMKLICSNNPDLATLQLPSGIDLLELNCSYCAKLAELDLTSIKSLKNLFCYGAGLTSLDCSGKGMSELGVFDCTSLKTLNCSNNKLSSRGNDTSFLLRNLPELESFDCSNNSLSSVGGGYYFSLLGSTKLKHFSIYGNPVSNFSASLPAGNESTLYAWKDGNIDLTASEISALKSKGWQPYYYDNATQQWLPYDEVLTETIPIDENHFPDAAFRAYLKSQTYGQDEMLTVSEIASVVSMSISGYPDLENLQGIEHFTHLAELSVIGSKISTLDFSGNQSIRRLKLTHGELTRLNVANCPQLQLLNVRNNELTELDLTGCSLGALDISHNRLSGDFEITLSPFRILTWDWDYWSQEEYYQAFFDELWETVPHKDWICESFIDCSYNHLTGLDLSGSERLAYVNCDDNELEWLRMPCNSTTGTGGFIYEINPEYYDDEYDVVGFYGDAPKDYLENAAYATCHSAKYLSCDNNKLTSIELTGEKWLGLYENIFADGMLTFFEGEHAFVPCAYGADAARGYSVVNNGKHLPQVEKAYAGEGKYIYYLRLTEPLQDEQHIDIRLSCGFDLNRVLSWNSGAQVVHGERELQAALGRRGIKANIDVSKVYGDILLLDEDAQRVTYTYDTGADHETYYETPSEVFSAIWGDVGSDLDTYGTVQVVMPGTMMPIFPAIEGDDPVARADFFFTWDPDETKVVTGMDLVRDSGSPTQSVTYVNPAGQASDRPWQGVNIVVTRYTDGTTRTTKLVK